MSLDPSKLPPPPPRKVEVEKPRLILNIDKRPEQRKPETSNHRAQAEKLAKWQRALEAKEQELIKFARKLNARAKEIESSERALASRYRISDQRDAFARERAV